MSKLCRSKQAKLQSLQEPGQINGDWQLKRYYPDTDQIPAEFIQWGGKTIYAEIFIIFLIFKVGYPIVMKTYRCKDSSCQP